MAIHGKQLKDASIDLTKLEGIAAAPTAGQLLVAAANGSMQALTVGGNLSASVSGSTLDLSIAAGTIQLSMIDGDAIISEAEGIASNDNDTTIPTSAAVKDYVDTEAAAQDLDFSADTGTGAVLLDSQTLSFAGGAGIDTSASGKTVTLAIDSSVATLTGTQTLTNKTLTSAVLDTGVSGSAILDEDNMASDSATQLATQQSIKAYADTKLPLAGGTMSGNIAMGTKSITGMADPTSAQDAATKAYVDASITGSGSMSSFDISDGTNSNTITHGETLTFTGTSNEVEVAVSPTTEQVTIGLPNDVTIPNNLTVTGDLTVSGTTTTVNSTTVTVDDKNLELGSVATPTDTTADGGGITLKGATDKTFNWVDASDSWTSSEHMDLAATKEYKIGTTSVLSADGAAKVQSAVAATNGGLAHSAGALSVDVDDDSVKLDTTGKVYAAALEYSELDQSLSGLTSPITATGDTGLTIAKTPAQNSAVVVMINGLQTKVGDGTKVAPLFFSADSGTSARNIKDIQSGDSLYFDATEAGYSLDSNDIISVVYQHARTDR